MLEYREQERLLRNIQSTPGVLDCEFTKQGALLGSVHFVVYTDYDYEMEDHLFELIEGEVGGDVRVKDVQERPGEIMYEFIITI